MKSLPFNISPRRATFALAVVGGLSACTDRPLQGVPLPSDPNAAGVVGAGAGAIIGDLIAPNDYGGIYGGLIGGAYARDEAQRRGRCNTMSNTRFDPVTGRVLGGSGNQRCQQTGPYEGVPAGRLGLPSRRNYFVEPEVQKDDTPDVWLGM